MQSTWPAVRNRTAFKFRCTRRRQRFICAICCIMLPIATANAQQRLSGLVSDSSGAAIANARVEFRAGEDIVRTATDSSGNFTGLSTQSYGTLSITSPGFNTVRVHVSTANGPLQIRLEPATVIERI